MSQARAAFFDEIVQELRQVPLARLPAIVATIRGARGHGVGDRGPTSRGTAAVTSEAVLAELVLALPTTDKLAEVQRIVVLHAVQACDGNISAAARLLGVDRKVLERRVARAKRARA